MIELELFLVETYFDDPSEVIQVIEALADPTRRKMLLLMQQNAPKGLTASQLADLLRKKIPTILHHLKSLEELGLAGYSMEKITGGGREVKHWKISQQQLILKIDMNSIGFLPENYIITLFEEYKGVGGSLSTDFGKKITKESIRDLLVPKIPDITDRHVEIIKTQLKKKKDFEHFLEKWIYQEFVNSAGSLQLDFFEFGQHFALSEDLRRIMFEKLMESQNFSSYGYSEEGRPIQRMALRPEYLRSLQQ
jgi:DNA-binding transcriptional ArsR family regulator